MKYTIKFILALLLLFSMVSLAAATTHDVTAGQSIQSAIDASGSGDTIHVHAGTYTITSSIILKSGITIYGDGVSTSSGTIIKFASRDNFASSASPGAFYCNGVSNVYIYGMRIDGAETSLAVMHDLPNNYREYCQGVTMKSSSYIEIHDMYFTMMMGDCINGYGTSHVKIYNCQMLTPGHDGVDNWNGGDWQISNIIVNTFANSGIKLAGATATQVSHSTFYSDTGSGYCGVQLMTSQSNTIIDHCIFGPMGNSVRKGVVSDTADGAVTGTVAITNNIFYSCSGGNIVVTGPTVTNTGNQYPTSKADWVSLGYGFNVSQLGTFGGSSGNTNTGLPIYNGSVLPTLTFPSNGALVLTTNMQLAFSWSNVNASKYYIEVASDNNFTDASVVAASQIDNGDTSCTITLNNGTYYWRVTAYDDVHSKWTDYTSAYSFRITGDEYILTGGIYGYLYDSAYGPQNLADGQRPVDGSKIKNGIVYLFNLTWSASCVTDSDGKYQFDNIYTGAGSYNMYARAKDYVDTPHDLPITLNSSYIYENIALAKAQSYISPNYVTITVMAPWGTKYSNVQVDARAEGNTGPTPDESDKTDDSGQVIFVLDKDIKHYNIRCYDPEQNIEKSVTISPSSTAVQVWVWNAVTSYSAVNHSINDQPAYYAFEDIMSYGVGWDVDRDNLSLAYINMSFGAKPVFDRGSDTTSSITSWYVSVFQVDQFHGNASIASNGEYVYLYEANGTGDNAISIKVPSNRSYVAHFELYDSLRSDPLVWNSKQLDTRSGIMQGFNLGWTEQWNYELVGIVLIFLMGGLFGARSAGVGAVMCLVMGWFFNYIGWFVWDTAGAIMGTFAIIIVAAFFLLGGR